MAVFFKGRFDSIDKSFNVSSLSEQCSQMNFKEAESVTNTVNGWLACDPSTCFIFDPETCMHILHVEVSSIETVKDTRNRFLSTCCSFRMCPQRELLCDPSLWIFETLCEKCTFVWSWIGSFIKHHWHSSDYYVSYYNHWSDHCNLCIYFSSKESGRGTNWLLFKRRACCYYTLRYYSSWWSWR